MGRDNRFGKNSITKHWLWNSLSVVTLMLIIIEVLLVVVIRNYYYSSVKQYVTSKMNVVTSSIMRSHGESEINYNAEIRSLVEGYAEKEKIELMAIKTNGQIDVTSSGFLPVENMEMLNRPF